MEAIATRSKASLPAPFQFGQQASPQSAPMVQVGDGPVQVVWSKADQIFQDIMNCCPTDRLPRYKGDLELINHSAGSLTSQAYQKRWIRKNELLADAAEKASLAAALLGGRTYPLERLNNAWTLVMGGQFHDILPGTATPKAFEYAWNDDVVAMNQFAGVLTSAAGVVAGIAVLAALRRSELQPARDVTLVAIRGEEAGSWFRGQRVHTHADCYADLLLVPVDALLNDDDPPAVVGFAPFVLGMPQDVTGGRLRRITPKTLPCSNAACSRICASIGAAKTARHKVRAAKERNSLCQKKFFGTDTATVAAPS